MKLRTGYHWQQVAEYSSSLNGLSVNLLVRDIKQALNFQQDALWTKAN